MDSTNALFESLINKTWPFDGKEALCSLPARSPVLFGQDQRSLRLSDYGQLTNKGSSPSLPAELVRSQALWLRFKGFCITNQI